MEELFNGQLSFADIEAEKFLQIRRTHADRRVNAMDRLTDDVINELIQLCLPHYHINEHDITHLGDLLKGLEKMVFLDSGYIGCAKRTEIQAIPFKEVSWYIAAKPSAWKKNYQSVRISEANLVKRSSNA